MQTGHETIFFRNPLCFDDLTCLVTSLAVSPPGSMSQGKYEASSGEAHDSAFVRHLPALMLTRLRFPSQLQALAPPHPPYLQHLQVSQVESSGSTESLAPLLQSPSALLLPNPQQCPDAHWFEAHLKISGHDLPSQWALLQPHRLTIVNARLRLDLCLLLLDDLSPERKVAMIKANQQKDLTQHCNFL